MIDHSSPWLALALAMIDAVAVWAIAMRMFGSREAGLAATTLLLLSPTHAYYSLVDPTPLRHLPFVTVWLWCVVEFDRRGDARLLVLSALILGVGCYAYLGAVVLMPVYFAVTLWLLLQRGLRRAALHAVAAFGIPVGVGLVWLISEPHMYTDLVLRYRAYDAMSLTPLQGVKDFLNYNNVQQRVSLYWGYLDPAFLFLGVPRSAPGMPGAVLPFVTALALPFGLVRVSRDRRATGLAIVAGLLIAPLAAVCVDEPQVARRALAILPFATLAAVAGVNQLSSRWRGRLLLAIAGVTAVQGAITIYGTLTEP